jgi:putative ABC transport system permease protein
MSILYTIKNAFDGLRANKARSALTTLGIVIGIMAIIVIVSIGRSAEQVILDQVSGFGADMLSINAGKEPTGPSDMADALFADSLGEREVEALKKKENVPDLVSIAPAVLVSGSVSYQGETYRPVIYGWDASFFQDMMDVYTVEGAIFDEDDIRQKQAVAIIGHEVKTELFGNDSAVGKNIKIKNKNFRVVGVYEEKGATMIMNIDKLVLIPYSTARVYLAGIDHYHEIDIRVSGPEVVDRAVADIERTLRELHDITDPEKDDFFITTSQAAIEQIGVILNALTVFLSSVVAIALVVGGIGVMNIMLVSVTERTKEIGLRKALGATNGDIRTQFIVEAMMLTGMGGIFGVLIGGLIGLGASYGVAYALNAPWVFSFPVSAAFLGVGVSMIVGLVFGLYPAHKASKKSPIEALRYE